MAEVRVQAEGQLWWVQASGSGTAWATASAPASGLVGFCTDFTMKSGVRTKQMADRGVPNHHKILGKDPIEVSFGFLWTGTYATALTASGASVPLQHLEFKASRPEDGASGYYYQFHGALLENINFTEAEDGDAVKLSYKTLAMVGPAATGYLK